MIFSRGKDAILSMDLTSSSEIFVKKEFVSDKAENHWPRRFKEDYISFIFQNVYSSKDLIYQTHWICCEKLNMIQITIDAMNIEWITMKVVLKVAEGWILPMEIRISGYETVIKSVKVLKL